MRVLALEPYFGGSHKAFLDGWGKHSRHSWTVLSLPPNKWKWRMRHSAISFSEQITQRLTQGETWDVIFCSDMLNLAEFLGLAPAAVRDLPVLAYFHENQLNYPVEHEKEYDYHFALSNMTTALAAKRVWFNSAFNRDAFLSELEAFLKRMPDHQPLDAMASIRDKSDIRHPCIDPIPAPARSADEPVHIAWAARWEYDKNPGLFFDALDQLDQDGVAFRLSVVGGFNGRNPLPVFEEAQKRFSNHIVNWGYLESRAEYEEVLGAADVAVSTANHEFFGLSMVEAAAAGAYPLVPRRLAYPEVFEGQDRFFYETDADLAPRLKKLAAQHANGDLWQGDPTSAIQLMKKYLWSENVPQWDDELDQLV